MKSTRYLSIALGTSMLSVVACGGGTKPSEAAVSNVGTSLLKPTRGVHLRSSFDNDPSTYVGRMIRVGVAQDDVDENSARQTRCGQFVKSKVVGSGESRDELMYVSSSAAASVGVALVANAQGSTSSGAVVRVRYTVTDKMQSEVTDQAAFELCCKQEVGQCDGLMIGTFLRGSGTIYQEDASSSGVTAGGTYQSVGADLEVKDNRAWKKVTSFDGTYFAFLTSGVNGQSASGAGYPELAGDCTALCNNPPRDADGRYFCGVSPFSAEESVARDYAERDAQTRVLRYLGTELSAGNKSAMNLYDGYTQDEQFIQSQTSGYTSKVETRKWCPVERQGSPKGPTFKQRVVAYFPRANEKAFARVTLEAILQKRKAEGKLTNEEETALRQLIEQQR